MLKFDDGANRAAMRFAGQFGIHHTVHDLGSRSLFSDHAMAALLSWSSPQSMQAAGDLPKREVAQLVKGADGIKLLDDVRRGNVAHVVRRPERFDLRCEALLNELAARHRDDVVSQIGDQELAVIVAGRGAELAAGSSGRETALWMVRGSASVALGRHRLTYAEAHALADLGGLTNMRAPLPKAATPEWRTPETVASGQMLAWPQLVPDAIEFRDALNVAVVTTRTTIETRRFARVLAANAFLEAWTGRRLGSASTSGLSGRSKSLAGMVLLGRPHVAPVSSAFAFSWPNVVSDAGAASSVAMKRFSGPAAD